MYRTVHLSTTSRAGAIALAVAAVAVGGVFLLFGLALLVSLAAVGALLGAGLVLYRRLTGRLPRFLRVGTQPADSLDPRLEVFPAQTPAGEPLAGSPPTDPVRPLQRPRA